MRRRLVPAQVLSALGLSLALLAAACGDDDQQARTTDDPSSSTTTAPAGEEPGQDTGGQDTGDAARDGALVSLDVHGGFVPVEVNVGDTAEVVVLTDGRVLSGAPVIAIYPGPALPPFQVSTAGQAAIDELLDAAEALDPDADYAQPRGQQVADAPDTTVTLHRGDGTTVSITAYALGMGDETGPRGELQDVVDAINALAAGNGATPYEPTALRVHDVTDLVGPPAEPGPGEPAGTVRDWPVPHTGAECTELTDPALVAAALEVLRQSTQLDRFRTDVGDRRLVVVPLLPGDPGCPDA